MICWPSIQDPGLVCACGDFKATGVRWDIAKNKWREHFLAEWQREQDRVHQDRT